MASEVAMVDAEPEGPAIGVGGDLRALRKARGLTLVELARRVGRSVGWLSQVERGIAQPSIPDLRRLAAALGQPLSFFFGPAEGPEAERGHVVRAGSRRVLGNAAEGLTEALLSPDLGGAFEILRSEFAPGAALAETAQRATEEAGYLISGRLTVWVGGARFDLRPGDSFRFKDEPFRWENPGTEPAVAIWVVAPPVY